MAYFSKLMQKLLPVVIVLLAFALRISALDQIPAGLSHDEAYNGITAMQVLDGQRLIFFEINKGIEPLIIYLEALAFHFFGIGPVPLRLVNVVFGMLTVALVYPLTARLFNRRVALLAMAGLAVSFWAVFVSRLTLRAVLLPPLLLLTLYLFWRGLKPIINYQLSIINYQLPISNLLLLALSGLTAGIAMYTSLSSRFIPFIVITIFGYQLIRRQINKHHWLGLLLHLLIWAAVFTPLGNYFLENRESFTHRSNQVTTIPHALNGEFEPMMRNSLRTLGMFTFRGDTTDRYNLDGRPVFDWVNGLFFYLGLVLILWRTTRSPKVAGPAVLLLSATFFMLLPDFITDDSPHFLRTIGAMPMVYIFWAVGLDCVAQQIKKLQNNLSPDSRLTLTGSSPNLNEIEETHHASRITSSNLWLPASRIIHHSSLARQGFIILLLTLTTLHTGYDYFGRWAASPNARYIYGADIAEIAQHIKSIPSQDLTVISAEYYQDLDPFRFTLHFQGRPPFVIWFDGRQTLAFPPPESNLSPRYVFPISAPPADIWTNFLQRSPRESGQEYTLYRLPDPAPLRELQNTINDIGVNVNNDLILSGYQLLGDVESGGKFQILLSWQALRALPPGTDYTFLVRMRDSQGRLWVETDGNGYAPGDWQPGVQALQLLTLRLPEDLPPRAYHLTAEVVDRRSGQALLSVGGETVIPLEAVTTR